MWTGYLTQLPGKTVSKQPATEPRPNDSVEPRKPADVVESTVVVVSRQRPKEYVVQPKTTIFDYYPDDLDVDFDRHVSKASRGSVHKPLPQRSNTASRKRLAKILRHRRISVSSQLPEIVRYYEAFQRLRRVMASEMSRDPVGSIVIQRAETGGADREFPHVSKYDLIHSASRYIQRLDRRLAELEMDAKHRSGRVKAKRQPVKVQITERTREE